MLSFQVTDNGKTVTIFCDKAGLKILSDTIEQLKKDDSEDVKLYSPLRGGNDLNETNPWGAEAVSEVLFSIGGD